MTRSPDPSTEALIADATRRTQVMLEWADAYEDDGFFAMADPKRVRVLAALLDALAARLSQAEEALQQNDTDGRWIVGQWQRLHDEPVREVALAIVDRCMDYFALAASSAGETPE